MVQEGLHLTAQLLFLRLFGAELKCPSLFSNAFFSVHFLIGHNHFKLKLETGENSWTFTWGVTNVCIFK